MSFVRQMEKAEIADVNHLLSRAFTQGRIDDGYHQTHIPLCRPLFLEMYQEECPEGCLVISERDRILGVSFNHIWGKTGWIGPLAVDPDFHLSGIGKKITTESIQFLKYNGCTTIGLETNPRSARNIGFYGRLGFVTGPLTADMIRAVPINADNHTQPLKIIFYSECSDSDQGVFCDIVKKLVAPNAANIDYVPLINSLTNFGFGDSVLFMNGSVPVAYCSFQTRSTSIEEEHYVLRIVAFAANPQTPLSYFEHFFAALESIARNRELDQLLLRLSLDNTALYHLFLEMKFKIIHTDQRMTLKDFPERLNKNAIYFNRWV